MSQVVVERLSNAMRSAIERLPQQRLPGGRATFPAGNCLPASLLLGAYLADSGVPGFECAYGQRSPAEGKLITHVWLTNGDLLADITADQFEEVSSSVIVTRSSDWHQTFWISGFGASDFREMTERTNQSFRELSLVYDQLRPFLFQGS